MLCDMIPSTTNKVTDKNDWRIYAYRIECMNATYQKYQKDENGGNHYEEEFDRVVIHGILHLCGINDKGPGEREIMEAAENAALEIR